NPLFKHSSTRFNIFLFSLMICFLAKLRKMMGLGKMELAGGILSFDHIGSTIVNIKKPCEIDQLHGFLNSDNST
ncbi:MAG: hypothetical protein M3Q58_01130, partial [Bacteroidota bacterium]|nr:hypothetical protein [Bacteroidota bacterium]